MEEVRTNDSSEYKFFPVQTLRKHFSIQASNDAWISFTSGPSDTSPMVEVYFGTNGNTKSGIKFNKEQINGAEEDTPGLLTLDEQRQFTIEWAPNGTLFQVYGGEDTVPFLTMKNIHSYPVTYYGVKTINGSRGDWVVDDMNFVGTADMNEYNYYPIDQYGGRIEFKVKASKNASICLTSGPVDTKPIHEIVLGGWDNTRCGILYNKDADPVSESGPGLLSDAEMKSFWIEWNYARLKVGQGGNPDAFLVWDSITPHVVTHFGISTTDTEGIWSVPSENAGGRVPIESGEITFGPGGDGQIDEKIGWIPPEPPKPAPKLPDVTPQQPSGWVPPPQPSKPADDDSGKRTPRAVPTPMVSPASGYHGQSHWVESQGGKVPQDAVQGGHDGGQPIYVGRAKHARDLLPGKLVPSHGVVYVAYGGGEHGKAQYEVLVAPPNSVKWVSSSGGSVPGNAIPGGNTSTGETLFIGRSPHSGTLTIGKIHPSHGNLYISYGGKEIGYREYEVLVSN